MAVVGRLLCLQRSVVLTRVVSVKTNTSLFSTEALDDEVRLEYLDGDAEGIAVMSINRPAQKNALSKNLMRLFAKHVDTLSNDKNIRAVILRSIVPKVFCAGADLKERKLMTEADIPIFVGQARAMLQQVHLLPVPTICALEGAALGGGLEIALSCDFRVASTTAKLGLPETKLAIIPGAGGTVRLPRIVGISKAKELIYTGKILGSVEAAAIGLVEHSVEQNENGDAAYERSLQLAMEITSQGPIALRMAKKSINEGIEVDIDTALDIEGQCYAQVVPTKDRVRALQAFAEKKKPVFEGN